MNVLEPIVGITPFERPDPGLAIALARAGALAVLDLGRDPEVAEAALEQVRRSVRRFGVRVPRGVNVALPESVEVVVVDGPESVAPFRGRQVLAQVTSLEEARAALAAGANGLIAKGNEAGGRIGDEPLFILLQRILGQVTAPVWAQGGIGLRSAAACIAAGARGVVLDTQLALLPEASTSQKTRRAIGAMDGSETRTCSAIASTRARRRRLLPKARPRKASPRASAPTIPRRACSRSGKTRPSRAPSPTTSARWSASFAGSARRSRRASARRARPSPSRRARPSPRRTASPIPSPRGR